MNKINILFDAKIFLDSYFTANLGRSGVFFVAWNILQIMQKNNNIHIILTYPAEYKNTIKLKRLKRDAFFLQFNFVCILEYNEYSIIQNIEKYMNNKYYIKLFYNYFRLIILYIKKTIYYKIYYNKKHFKNAHIYLSPYYPIPKNIINQAHIKKFYILHDAISLIFPEYFISSVHKQLIDTFNNEIYSFCVSQSCKDDFLKYCGDKLDSSKMFVTHNATNQHYSPNYNKKELLKILKKYGIEHDQSDKYLFSLCSLEPRKNLSFTIICFIKFIKKHNIHDLYFYLGGNIWKNFEFALEKTLEYAGIFRQKIKLLGYIDDSDTNILYSNSLFFIYLSQYEGFGMPPLEAMQAGTPVITSNNSSLPEVVGDAAISLTYNDEEAVIKAFEDFYFNENLRKEYIKKGLERAKMFSWEKCVGKMTEVIEGIVKCSEKN